MKCRYSKCQLGGDVEKEDAIKDGSAYYHQECWDKKVFKQQIQEYYLQQRKIFSRQDWNIALSRMVDTQLLDIKFIDFVAKKKIKDIDSPYKIMYYCKFDDLKDEYAKKVREELGRKQMAEFKKMEVVEEEFSFKHIESKPIKRYNIY